MSYKNPQESSSSLRSVQAQISEQRRQMPLFAEKNSISPTQFFVSHNQQNAIFDICYNGEARQFALSGQLLRKGEEFNPLPPLVE